MVLAVVTITWFGTPMQECYLWKEAHSAWFGTPMQECYLWKEAHSAWCEATEGVVKL